MGKFRHKNRQQQSADTRVEERKHSAEVNKSLTEIFRDESGKMPDMTHLDRHRPNVIAWILGGIAGFIVILICAIWVGFAIFKPFSGFSGNGFQIVIDGSERIALGQETTYFINYHNVSSDPLATAEIRISFPPDFSATKLDPQPTGNGFVWKLGSIPAGGRGTILIKGMFSGALGTHTAIQAVGTYRPGSFNSDFEELTTRKIEYAETVLDGLIEKPAKALPGDKVRIVYQLQNNGSNPLERLEARITLPTGFVREASSTEGLIDESIVRIPVGTIAAGATTSVSVVGTFASGASGDLLIHAEVGRVGVDGTFQPAQKADSTISVLAGDLLLKLVVNGSDTDRSVSAQESLRFALAYENTSPEELKDIVLRVKFEPAQNGSSTSEVFVFNPKPPAPALVDWKALEDSSSGTVSGNTITWDKKGIGELERLPPQMDGIIEFALPVAFNRTASGTSDVPFQVTVEGTMAKVGTTIVNRTIKTKPITFRLRTDADVRVEAWYFSEEGAPLGSGPLPPIVGQTTSYRIQWDVQKTLHELSNVRISAVLPKNVTWPAKSTVTAGDLGYDESTRTVSWTLNRLPADVNEMTADFDVQLTPFEADANRFAGLLGETRFEAVDTAIGEPIVRIKPALTTDLQNDEGAKSKGVVKKP